MLYIIGERKVSSIRSTYMYVRIVSIKKNLGKCKRIEAKESRKEYRRELVCCEHSNAWINGKKKYSKKESTRSMKLFEYLLRNKKKITCIIGKINEHSSLIQFLHRFFFNNLIYIYLYINVISFILYILVSWNKYSYNFLKFTLFII